MCPHNIAVTISYQYSSMLLQKKLPTEFFEKQNIWLYRGNMYRLLVEPCDIANHYGHYGLKSMSGVGHYLEGNRPGRYAAPSGQCFWQLLLLADVFPGHKKRKRESSDFSVMASALMPAAVKTGAKLLPCEIGAPATLLVYSVMNSTCHRVRRNVEQHSLQCCSQRAAPSVLQNSMPEIPSLAQ